MSRVWVVEKGEKHEGGTVISVHQTRSGAEIAALAMPTDFEGGWDEVGDNCWENGCDYVKITWYDVEA